MIHSHLSDWASGTAFCNLHTITRSTITCQASKQSHWLSKETHSTSNQPAHKYFTNPSIWLPLKNISSCLTNKPTWVNRCTHRLCVKALTVAIANLHEWLEVSKQWGNRALPIIACYWYQCLVSLLWVQRNAFHRLSGHTMVLVLWCFLQQENWNDEMFQCAIVCFSIKFPYVADKWLHRPPSLQETVLCAPQFLFLHICGMHAGGRKNDNALALGHCALQYHNAYLGLFSSFNRGKQRGRSQRKEHPAAFTTSSSKWQLRSCPWKRGWGLWRATHTHYPFVNMWIWFHCSCTCICIHAN